MEPLTPLEIIIDVVNRERKTHKVNAAILWVMDLSVAIALSWTAFNKPLAGISFALAYLIIRQRR